MAGFVSGPEWRCQPSGSMCQLDDYHGGRATPWHWLKIALQILVRTNLALSNGIRCACRCNSPYFHQIIGGHASVEAQQLTGTIKNEGAGERRGQIETSRRTRPGSARDRETTKPNNDKERCPVFASVGLEPH